ncbi:unnamed protein product [Mortierella alpina]
MRQNLASQYENATQFHQTKKRAGGIEGIGFTSPASETENFDQLSFDPLPTLKVKPAIGFDEWRHSSEDRPKKKTVSQGIDTSQNEKCDRPSSPEATDLSDELVEVFGSMALDGHVLMEAAIASPYIVNVLLTAKGFTACEGELPPKAEMNYLLDLYFKHVYPFSPMFVRKTFMREYQQKRPTLHMILLLNAIFAVACPYSDGPAIMQNATMYFGRAKLILDETCHVSAIATIQSLILMSPPPGLSWCPPWWIHAYGNGSSDGICDDDTADPQFEGERSISCRLLWMVQLSKVLGGILETVHSFEAETNSDHRSELFKSQELAYEPSSSQAPALDQPFTHPTALMHLLWNLSWIILYLPYFRDLDNNTIHDTTVATATSTCLAAADSIRHISESLLLRGQLRDSTLFTATCLIYANTVYSHYGTTHSPEAQRGALEGHDRLARIALKLTKTYPAADVMLSNRGTQGGTQEAAESPAVSIQSDSTDVTDFHDAQGSPTQTGKKLPEWSLLQQNLHRIRTLDFVKSLDVYPLDFLGTLFHGLPVPSTTLSSETVADRERKAEEGTVALCWNLRRLKAAVQTTTDRHRINWTLLQSLLHNNNNLTHLHVEFDQHTPLSVKEAFTALRRLQHLTVKGHIVEESWFLSLLEACLPLPRLSKVYCQFGVKAGDYTFEGDSGDESEVDVVARPQGELKTILEKAIIARTSSDNGSIDVKIKTLQFPDALEDDIMNIILPVWRSELVEIETLEVPQLVYYRPDAFYEEMARKYCSGLKHLVIPPYYGEDHPTAVCCFIRAATGLRTVRGRSFTDAYGSTSSKMMPTLVAHHFRTLEELELVDCKMIRSPDQQAILASCRNLKRFWVVSDDVHRSELGLRFLDIVDREWVCLGLRELGITLRRAFDLQLAVVALRQELSVSNPQKLSEECEYGDKGPHSRPDQEQVRRVFTWLAKRVYTQLGQLVVLETLALSMDQRWYVKEDANVADWALTLSEWDLTLSKGWLAELSALKNLRSLQLGTDYWSRMGQAEVEFMDAHWPLLGDIGFKLEKSELQDLVKQPHWQWLQQKRPHLRLTTFSTRSSKGVWD